MDYFSELKESLNDSLSWNKARIMCFVTMLVALLRTRTVNLSKLACSIISDNTQLSRYRRLQRFFSDFEIDYDCIAGFIFKLFFMSGGEWYLTIDRTNWK